MSRVTETMESRPDQTNNKPLLRSDNNAVNITFYSLNGINKEHHEIYDTV